MNIGMTAWTKVRDVLESLNTTFSDCYKKPDILKFALKHGFDTDEEYLTVIEKIRTEFGSLVDEDNRIAEFMQKLSK